MRPPLRAVADYDVDRAQVQRRRRQSRALLIARELPARGIPRPLPARLARAAPVALPAALCMWGKAYPGGHCAGVPPLPIPNREVKPGCADGTAPQCGRVGGRRLFDLTGSRVTDEVAREPFFVHGDNGGAGSSGRVGRAGSNGSNGSSGSNGNSGIAGSSGSDESVLGVC